jgi:hypothetical protein
MAPVPARTLPVGAFAVESRIQSLALPALALTRRAVTGAHLGDAGAAGGARELGEPAVGGRAERGADALRMLSVDHDAAGLAVDHPQLGVVAAAHRAAEALDRDLEVHDRALVAVRLRDERGVGDDPLVGVGRDVGLGLVRLPGIEREGRREERRPLLLGREVRRGRDVAAHHARELLAVDIDEARLTDARRVQALEIAQLVRDVGQVAALPAHLLLARTRLCQHVSERGRVRRQQHD